MKTTDQEVEDKRLKKNAYQRRRYAQLSQGKKYLLLQKKKEKYAAAKKFPPKDAATAGEAACSYTTLTNHTYAQASKGITIKDTSTDELIGKDNHGTSANPALQSIALDKGKAQISFLSSYERGEPSLHTNQASSSTNEFTPLAPDEEINIVDEIQQFQSARWISAAEAMWRIYRFTMNDMRPSVQRLHLHLEGEQKNRFSL